MAGYIEQSLQVGETIDYRGRVSLVAATHRAIITIAVGIVVIAIAGDAKGSAAGKPSGAAQVWATIAGFAILLGIYRVIRGLLFAKAAEYAVTDRRIIGKYGLVRRVAVDVMMSQMAGVSVAQTTLGRIFGYGTLWVNGSGARRALVGLKDPLVFQKAVYKRLEESKLLKGTAAYTLDVRMAPNGQDRPPSAFAPPRPPASATKSFCVHCGATLAPAGRHCGGCGALVG